MFTHQVDVWRFIAKRIPRGEQEGRSSITSTKPENICLWGKLHALYFFFSAMPRKYFHLSLLVVLWGGFLSVVISQTKCELISTKPGLVIIASLFSFVGCHALLMAVRYFTGLAVGGCSCSHRSGPCLALKYLLTLGFTKWLRVNVLFGQHLGLLFFPRCRYLRPHGQMFGRAQFCSVQSD